MTVTSKQYSEEKSRFIKEHGKKDWHVETSSMDEYGTYYKDYIFDDGAIWNERMSVEWIKQEVEINYVKVEVEVKLQKIEFWNNKTGISKFYYEKY